MISGVIYDSWLGVNSGAMWLELPEVSRWNRIRYRIPVVDVTTLPDFRPSMVLLSQAAVLIGSAGLFLTMLPVGAMEAQYWLRQLTTANDQQTTGENLALFVPTQAPVGPRNEYEAFSIRIPKIGADSLVLPNVDAASPALYMPALKRGVAHALGTGLPGVDSKINKTIYVFAHSTSAPALVEQYNAQFYLLHKLVLGDEISVTYWAREYRYRVRAVLVTEPDDTSWLTPQTEEELLVLATCTPPGTTWKRLLVIAERMADQP